MKKTFDPVRTHIQLSHHKSLDHLIELGPLHLHYTGSQVIPQAKAKTMQDLKTLHLTSIKSDRHCRQTGHWTTIQAQQRFCINTCQS